MYEINEENLKWAYQKFKQYVFYYGFSSYLKTKIIEFERQETEDSFNKMCEKINLITKKERNMLTGENISFIALPKKDKLSIENGKIKIEDFNMFLDMPIEFYLVDILFTVDLIKNIDKDIFESSYGIVIDDKLLNIKNNKEYDILNNKYLFANYKQKYGQWKYSINKCIDDNKEKEMFLLKLDLKKCYYNLDFNIEDFIEKYCKVTTKNSVAKIVSEIYRYYTKILVNNINCPETNSYHVHLPIGPLSSYVILNILLSQLDEQLKKYTLGYARYVDDIMMVIEGTPSIDNIQTVINSLKELVIEDNDDLVFNEEKIKCKKLIINKNKINIIKNIEKSDFSYEIEKLTYPSIMFDDCNEINNDIDIGGSNTFKYIRNNIFGLRYADKYNEKI